MAEFTGFSFRAIQVEDFQSQIIDGLLRIKNILLSFPVEKF